MTQSVNYQKELEKVLQDESQRGTHLFLHSCCAPCSSYVLTYLSTFFNITVFYYNPNITEDNEYRHRVEEQKRLIYELNRETAMKTKECPNRFPIAVLEGDYDRDAFLENVKGHEQDKEGGARCAICFRMRLKKTVEEALIHQADYVTTTLTISPLKNAELLNNIGMDLCKACDVKWLPSDFKKKDGYKQSIELSKKYDLYRQDYCGCIFSKENDI